MSAVMKAQQYGPGVYEGLPMAEYLAMPAVSASMVITLLERCPRAAWFGSWLNPRRPVTKSTEAQSVGTLAHELLLEGSLAQLAVIDPAKYPAKTTGEIPKGWTNDNIKKARNEALAAGKVPVFPAVAAEIEAMVVEARSFLASTRESEPAVHDLFQPGGGRSEVTIVWEEDGCLFRMRPDRLAADLLLMGDVKTTAAVAEPDRWGRTQLFGMGYYVAAAFYRRGLAAATGKRAEYVYLVQEQDAPYLCSLVALEQRAIALGEAKADRAIAVWKNCVKTGVWPGYPTRVAYIEAPPWEVQREEEMPRGVEYDPAKLWQKPARAFANESDPAV